MARLAAVRRTARFCEPPLNKGALFCYLPKTMDLARLIEKLSEPGAYPGQVSNIEIRHTHISVVFLAGPYAYKIKKPVQFGFLDFSTLQKRHHFCHEEVRLNRRLAPDIYLGVVPVADGGTRLLMEGQGE